MKAKHFQTGADSCSCGQPWPHAKAKGTKQKLVKVYKVIEYDPPEENTPHTWRLIEIPVASASDKMIIMARMTSALGHRTRFSPDMLGRMFHATPAGAVIHFLKEQNMQAQTAKRWAEEATRAIAWVSKEFAQFLDGASDTLPTQTENTDG